MGIASVDIAGPYHCGGVGAAYQGLALTLADAGHEVTLLYTHDVMRGSDAQWRRWYDARGVRFIHAPQPPAAPLWYSRRKEASLACHRALVAHGPFDVVHFHEWLGLPYYTLLAKRQGLAHADTLLCVGTHGPMRWSRTGEGRLPSSRDDLIVDYMERRSVELADVVVSPSRFMLEWMTGDGWVLPERSYVAQNLLQIPDRVVTRRHEGGAAPRIRELVFFGRLDRRKGVVFFCDVLDRLVEQGVTDIAVTFLGSVVALDEPSDEFVTRRAARWPFAARLETAFDREAALAYLAEPGRLAVMPSISDNLPCTVHECLESGIPFLSTDVGGTGELVEPGARSRVLATAEVDAFARRLGEIIASGQAPATLRTSAEDTRRQWTSWHASLDTRDSAVSSARESEPSVSVCLAHYERPRELAMMLESLRRQRWKRFEIIVADDGSQSEAARAALDALERELPAQGGSVLRLANGGPGAARHAAAERARGEYLLFVDDDDVAAPGAIETFVRAATHTDADVLVSAYWRFRGDGVPPSESQDGEIVVPLGPALAAALIYPELGGTMIFVRRDAYFASGGFPRERNVDEDWELLLALVSDGFELQVVPEPLYWYREREQSRSRADNRFARDLSRLKRFEGMLPLELRELAALAYAQLGGASDASGLKRTERVRAVLDQAARKRAEAAKKT